jgi:hypothetical protein
MYYLPLFFRVNPIGALRCTRLSNWFDVRPAINGAE